MKISAVILTNLEEKDINRTLKSIDFCDEKIILKGEISDFSAQRNIGMKRAKNDWILFIDDDEEISENLKLEILNLFTLEEKIDKDAYFIKRRDFFWRKELKYGETMKIRNNGLIRLIKKNSGRWEGKVHEKFKVQLVPRSPKDEVGSSKCKIGRLNNYLNHYPHSTVKEFIAKINYYSTLRAEELLKQGKKFSLCELIFFPFFKFILNYFIYFGILDGAEGFVYAFLMSFHSFLVRAKLYKRD